MKTNVRTLQKEILKREKGKKELNASQVSSVLAHLSDIIYDTAGGESWYTCLYKNGRRRKGR